MTSRRSSSPGAYKQVSRRYYPVPGPAVFKPVRTMAVLGSTLLPLGLFLGFGLLCSSASSADDIDKCIFFSEVATTGPGITANSDVYDSNRKYTGEEKPFSLLSFVFYGDLPEPQSTALRSCSQSHRTCVFDPNGKQGQRQKEREHVTELAGWGCFCLFSEQT